jgi:hypothetical protein
MDAPRSLAELPFVETDPRSLLNLRPGPDGAWRPEPDHDYAGFGWAQLDAIVLEAGDGSRRVVGPALVLALHSTDEPSPAAGVIELELDLAFEGVLDPLVVRAPLDRFLDVWLPRLPATTPHVVLALCNPLHLAPARPAALGGRTLHYAHGDVLSWLDHDDAGDPAAGRIRLHAPTWHTR